MHRPRGRRPSRVRRQGEQEARGGSLRQARVSRRGVRSRRRPSPRPRRSPRRRRSRRPRTASASPWAAPPRSPRWAACSSRPTQQAPRGHEVLGGRRRGQVRADYFNSTGFERWNKIYGETDDVNKVQLDIRVGHQQTVDKVLDWTAGMDMNGVTVCDAGCGTGSLAIPSRCAAPPSPRPTSPPRWSARLSRGTTPRSRRARRRPRSRPSSRRSGWRSAPGSTTW